MTRKQELKLLEHYTRKLAKDIPDRKEREAFANTLSLDIAAENEAVAKAAE